MRIGYARVSTEDQNLAVQIAQLQAAGCEEIFREKVSGAYASRPQLRKLMDMLRVKDVLVVSKLDRLARSTVDLLDLVQEIDGKGAAFVSLAEPWADTTTPAGKLIVTVFAGVAEFERARTMERCAEGRKHAMARGVKFGRKPVLSPDRRRKALELMAAGERLEDLAVTLNVSARSLYRLRREQ